MSRHAVPEGQGSQGGSPPNLSRLGDKHPDHPTLKALGLDLKDDSASSSSHGQAANLTSTPEPTSSTAGDTPSPAPQGGQLNQPQPRQHALQDGNARSKSITVANGEETFGSPSSAFSFRVGVAEDRNKRCRRTMEDAHSFVYDFAGIKGQGYFAVFDGHAGKHAAEWCGQNFHEYLLDATLTYPDQPVPDLFNKTFHTVDARLSHHAQNGRTSSGSTAAVAFLRCEKIQDDEPKGFAHPDLKPRGLMHGQGEEELERETAAASDAAAGAMGGGAGSIGGTAAHGDGAGNGNGAGQASVTRKHSGRRIRDFVRGLTGSDKREHPNNTIDEDAPADGEATDSVRTEDSPAAATSPDASSDNVTGSQSQSTTAASGPEAIEPQTEGGIRRVLYTANVGDARAVLCRKGKAVRLTYDHKGSDPQEAKRITDAGGFVMNNRVNGVLAVTRSLGDASVKEFVVGSPYTTETALDEGDEFLIVACDGLWDVCEDQSAVDIVRNIPDSQEAAKRLLDYAMTNFSTDNLSVMVIRFTHN